ncbi:hypothetical protein [Micromonospora sp. CPCC 206061]|uniref:hypothetical protein n=1 Tax=Micromonospora sp. CPCC 206061 TaxID=3122410 RepID=UPI002FF1E7EF
MTYDIEAEVRRRTRRIALIATAVVAVALAGIGGLAVWGGGDGSPPPAATSSSAAPSDGFGSALSETRSATDDLGTVTWVDVRGMALPVSARYGPATVAEGRAWGFAHNRFGSVMAATHIAVRADAIVGPRVYRPTIDQQVIGTDVDALASNVDSEYEGRRAEAGVAAGDPLPGTHASLAGYRVESYTDQAAFLRLLIASPGPNAQGTVYVDFRIEVRWAEGDWRLVAPPGGRWQNATGQAPSTNGYTAFPRRR